MSNHLLVRPNRLPTPPHLDGFRLDTSFLEQEMIASNGGVNLARIENGTARGEEYREFVPHFFGGRDNPDGERILQIANKYPEITAPCSMSLDSMEELAEHMVAGYQVSHFHYILGKKYNLNGTFPHSCCGTSSISVMLSLIELGYPNATYAYSNRVDHGYTVLPFVFEKEDIRGTVVIDPTHDQLWTEPHERNAVFLKLGLKWEYKTDWHRGADLFPDNLCSIDTSRITPHDLCYLIHYHKGGENFFAKAFSNPIKIKKPT